MKQAPLVSVVTLAYNHGKYIRQCLDGFVMQKTDFPFEVIIHDDASTDDTAEIIREYEQKYPDIIKPIYQTENQYSKKVPIGATYLYPKAQGKYIAECEGDDWWTDPYKLQKQVDFLESHPDYLLCSTWYSTFAMKDGSTRRVGKSEGERDITLRKLMKKNLIGTLTVLYRREVLDSYLADVQPFMPKFKMGDIPFWIYIASKGKIRELPYDTACYRILQSSASHSADFITSYDFLLDASRLRLWLNKFLNLHYAYRIRWGVLKDTHNFCRRWARDHDGSRLTLTRKALKHFRTNGLRKM